MLMTFMEIIIAIQSAVVININTYYTTKYRGTDYELFMNDIIQI